MADYLVEDGAALAGSIHGLLQPHNLLSVLVDSLSLVLQLEEMKQKFRIGNGFEIINTFFVWL